MATEIRTKCHVISVSFPSYAKNNNIAPMKRWDPLKVMLGHEMKKHHGRAGSHLICDRFYLPWFCASRHLRRSLKSEEDEGAWEIDKQNRFLPFICVSICQIQLEEENDIKKKKKKEKSLNTNRDSVVGSLIGSSGKHCGYKIQDFGVFITRCRDSNGWQNIK